MLNLDDDIRMAEYSCEHSGGMRNKYSHVYTFTNENLRGVLPHFDLEGRDVLTVAAGNPSELFVDPTHAHFKIRPYESNQYLKPDGSYEKLQGKLRNINIDYIDTNVLSVHEKTNKKFDAVFMSNISTYVSTLAFMQFLTSYLRQI